MYYKDWVNKGEYIHLVEKTPTANYLHKGIEFNIVNRVPSKSMICGLKQPLRCRYFISKGISFFFLNIYFSINVTILAPMCKMSFINLQFQIQVAYNPMQPNPHHFNLEWHPKWVDGTQHWSRTIRHPFKYCQYLWNCEQIVGARFWFETKGSSLNMRPAETLQMWKPPSKGMGMSATAQTEERQ